MKNNIIISLFFTIVLCLVPVSTFVPYEIVDNYFQLFPIACAVGVVAFVSCIVLFVSKVRFYFAISDMLFIVLIGWYLIRYDYQEQLANWKIIYAVLLCVFWFALRFILSCCPVCKKTVFYALALLGCIQTIWGILQIYGFTGSYHKMFAVTGSFYNPGPYTGYLAVIFPICLGQMLNAQKRDKYVWAILAVLLFSTIPAGLSRSAWGALIVSSLFVLSLHFQWVGELRKYFVSHFKATVLCMVLFLILGGTIAGLLISMRSDSVCGRLFIWKQTLAVIAQSPISGYGPGSFPKVYGQEQSAYFSQGDYSEWEERVAGSPVYAFNEYLQLTVEGGVVLLLLACAFIYYTFRKGYRTRQYGICGGLLSLCVFAFSAYPLQVFPFGVVGILLASLCVSNGKEEERRCFSGSIVAYIVSILLLVVSVSCIYQLKDIKHYKERVLFAHMLYSENAYQEAASAYESVYEKIMHSPKLLFRYAHVLMEQKQYSQAIEVLERTEKVSSDVAVLNAEGKCYLQLGLYEKAESCFIASTHRLPIRIYPYYMLAKLYTDSAYFNKEKFEKMSIIVLTKEPKVFSSAINEMRNEIRKLSINLN